MHGTLETPRIRSLTEADADTFRALRLRALRDHPEAFGASYEEEVDQPIERTVERLRASSSGSFVLGAFLGDALVGSVGLNRPARPKTQHRGTIWGMYVCPEASGRGIGRALLHEAIVRARAITGLEELTLGVTVGNERARRLYLAAGFVPYAIEPRLFKIDDRYYDLERMRLPLIA